jgi:hypothetical protein
MTSGAFALSQKAPVIFVMSVRLFACIILALSGRILVKFDLGTGENPWMKARFG